MCLAERSISCGYRSVPRNASKFLSRAQQRSKSRRTRDLFRWTLCREERDWKYGLASPLNHWSSTGESKSVSCWLLYSAHDRARMASYDALSSCLCLAAANDSPHRVRAQCRRREGNETRNTYVTVKENRAKMLPLRALLRHSMKRLEKFSILKSVKKVRENIYFARHKNESAQTIGGIFRMLIFPPLTSLIFLRWFAVTSERIVKAEEDTNETKRRKRSISDDAVGDKRKQRNLTTSFMTLIPRYERTDLSTFCDATSSGELLPNIEHPLEKLASAIHLFSDRLNFIN